MGEQTHHRQPPNSVPSEERNSMRHSYFANDQASGLREVPVVKVSCLTSKLETGPWELSLGERREATISTFHGSFRSGF